jgi:hypothetical protein
MKKLINYIRSCFWKHDWEMIFDVNVRNTGVCGEYSTYIERTYRCKKCGTVQKVKSN